ncbi:hypothetical protein [Spongiivirga citrea]|uniref:Uncharacterized protein n=1 Tax=Spongiivirga citrea TaxID=1481457 RepID=A0A6M0CGH8_9FLAO|nr:hypothetical protein [Spongiivirga citrea]NER17008.1 hypothetical protein [Spongiivirga citrea]
MSYMIKISLLLNIFVLAPVCYGLLSKASWVDVSYGSATAARGILLSVYIAILLSSILLFFKADPKFVAALLFAQVIYKLTTPFTVGTVTNSVVISNLFIAFFHTVTLFIIWKEGHI